MKNILSRASLLAALLLGAFGTAHASLVPMTFSSTYAPTSPFFMAGANTYSFVQSLAGFNPVTDTITSASLTFNFRDDGGPGDGPEKVSVFIDGTLVVNSVAAGSAYTYTFTAPFVALQDGSFAGRLVNMKVSNAKSATYGDFYFDSSVLTVNANRVIPDAPRAPQTNKVPEPASLALAGLGLLGLGVTRKRRMMSKAA